MSETKGRDHRAYRLRYVSQLLLNAMKHIDTCRTCGCEPCQCDAIYEQALDRQMAASDE